MKTLMLLVALSLSAALPAQQNDYAIQGVPFTTVKLKDNFWLPRILVNKRATIPASFKRCEATGRIDNFKKAAARKGKFGTKFPFDDTDIYKTIEGASYTLALYPDETEERYIDHLIEYIANAQEPDGYLYTARTINPDSVHPWSGKERWEKERELSHELYNAGHLYEAAVAHYMATKKTNLLNIAVKNADLVCSVFGPGKKHVAPGHEIVEMGLVKMYRVTGKKEYLATAKFFIEERGRYQGYDPNNKDPWKNGAYWQDHLPVKQQEEAVGHAVRAGYLYSAVADIAALTGDDSLLNAIDKIWTNVVGKKMYVQGSVGAIGNGERYGENYELPNATAYNETCAAISNVYWNYRMFLLHGESKYFDVLEKTLYNGLISGVSLDGKSFFYTNAMQITNNFKHKDIEYTRSGWFECSCCPTNLARLIPSVPGYVYAQKDDQVFVNLFINSNTRLTVKNTAVELVQQNNYPWDGGLSFTVVPARELSFAMLIRIPGWAQDEAVPSSLYRFTTSQVQPVSIKVNGVATQYTMQHGYAVIKRDWKKNDKIEVMLPMEIKRVAAGEQLAENAGKIALQRGPIVYCAEWVDNNGSTSNLFIPDNTVFTTKFKPGLLKGVTVLRADVAAIDTNTGNVIKQKFTAIPYYSWANRGQGEMAVWFPTAIKGAASTTRH
ncbi:glycoside hydrolase family 127 protein [Sediminibacterium roseum]|uniref:Glycoside hydrolase family 127 protein n=1 Tax=Sediminibacterium roseum TaxID=1978412 RepID=A0ABW9ZU05_9BACT|nr:glycoside hydrolase family 127 protein [Sediminibacterium roseum]NCI49852.1 glycoside hydrolase family 127 protein [Sediminibacterium roseum]